MSALAVYQHVRDIGEGRFSKVTLVKCHCKSSYAMKTFKDNVQFTEGERLKSIQRDLHLASTLKHRHLVKFTEYIIEEKRIYVIMDFCEAGNLHHHIRNLKSETKFLTEMQVFSMFTPVCVAVLYLHENKLIHRNINSRNVFLDAEEKVRLGDYGLATLLDSQLPLNTKVGGEVGTLADMAPELCKHERYDEKVDVWGLGCLLHEMCTLQAPFEKRSVDETVHAIIEESAPRIGSKHPDNVQLLVDRMLRKNPVERIAVGEILQDGLLQKYLISAATEKFPWSSNVEIPAGGEQQVALIRKLTVENEQTRQEIERLRRDHAALLGRTHPEGAYSEHTDVTPLAAEGVRHRFTEGAFVEKVTHMRDNVQEKIHNAPGWLRSLSLLTLALMVLLPLLGATFAAGTAYLLTHSTFLKHIGLPHFDHIPGLDHLPNLEDVPLLKHIPGIPHHEEEESLAKKILHHATGHLPNVGDVVSGAAHAAGHAAGDAGRTAGHAASSATHVVMLAARKIAKSLVFPTLMWASIPLLASLLGCVALFLLWKKAQDELHEARGGKSATPVPVGGTTKKIVHEETTTRMPPKVYPTHATVTTVEKERRPVTEVRERTVAYKDLGLDVMHPSQAGVYPVIDWTTLKSGKRVYSTEWQKVVSGEDINTTVLHFPPLLLQRQTAGERCVLLLFFKRVDISLHLLATVVHENPDDTRAVTVQQPLKIRVEMTLTKRDGSVHVVEQERVVAIQPTNNVGHYQTIMTLAPVPWTTLSATAPPRCQIDVTAAPRI